MRINSIRFPNTRVWLFPRRLTRPCPCLHPRPLSRPLLHSHRNPSRSVCCHWLNFGPSRPKSSRYLQNHGPWSWQWTCDLTEACISTVWSACKGDRRIAVCPSCPHLLSALIPLVVRTNLFGRRATPNTNSNRLLFVLTLMPWVCCRRIVWWSKWGA
jgi:hypothetical protein